MTYDRWQLLDEALWIFQTFHRKPLPLEERVVPPDDPAWISRAKGKRRRRRKKGGGRGGKTAVRMSVEEEEVPRVFGWPSFGCVPKMPFSWGVISSLCSGENPPLLICVRSKYPPIHQGPSPHLHPCANKKNCLEIWAPSGVPSFYPHSPHARWFVVGGE